MPLGSPPLSSQPPDRIVLARAKLWWRSAARVHVSFAPAKLW